MRAMNAFTRRLLAAVCLTAAGCASLKADSAVGRVADRVIDEITGGSLEPIGGVTAAKPPTGKT
jgi:hypothetical protein